MANPPLDHYVEKQAIIERLLERKLLQTQGNKENRTVETGRTNDEVLHPGLYTNQFVNYFLLCRESIDQWRHRGFHLRVRSYFRSSNFLLQVWVEVDSLRYPRNLSNASLCRPNNYRRLH